MLKPWFRHAFQKHRFGQVSRPGTESSFTSFVQKKTIELIPSAVFAGDESATYGPSLNQV
jgi:hypothetical protein